MCPCHAPKKGKRGPKFVRQKRLDQVPIKLKAHTDAIAALERQLEEVQLELRQAKASGDRYQLDVNAKEGNLRSS